MYCSTCGARIPEGRAYCDTCGAPVGARALSRGPDPAERVRGPDGRFLATTGTCPRCGYRGEGVTYFSRGSHVAALVGATMLTAGAMGAGGLIYYVVRRDHRVCPRCGRGWGKFGEIARAYSAGGLAERPRVRAPSKGGEAVKRGWSIALLVLSAVLLVGGISGLEIAPILFGLVALAGAGVLHRAANGEREARREALLSQLQLPVLRLAAERGGRLTVSEVAASLEWPMRRAERVLQSLDDGLRVDSEVTDEGVIVYLFRELLPPAGPEPRRLPDGGSGEAPGAS